MVATTTVTFIDHVRADAERDLGAEADAALREWIVREAVLDFWVSRRTVTLAAADAAVRRAPITPEVAAA